MGNLESDRSYEKDDGLVELVAYGRELGRSDTEVRELGADLLTFNENQELTALLDAKSGPSTS